MPPKAAKKNGAAMEEAEHSDETWAALRFEQQQLFLRKMTAKALAKMYPDHDVAFFEKFKKYVESMPRQVGEPAPAKHSPHKDLVVSARRDLSFFEANFELIDNSVDAWRRAGMKAELKIEITYDLELGTGKYVDNAGGLDKSDVYKVFIPGETTNRDLSQKVIGSFGMGAKKGIFRLTDGAKIVSCKNSKESCTSQVPEKWELDPDWNTQDGTAKPIAKGRTELYFFKLVLAPTTAQIADLIKRCGVLYRPLLAAEFLDERISITINGTKVKPGRSPIWSGAKGASPRIYCFTKTFNNFLESGQDVELTFRFLCGLTKKSAGTKKDVGQATPERDEDWGIDVFGNGRLIQRFRKREFGFGVGEKGLGRSPGQNYFRGELFIDGHSFAIPWDTHKREYLNDHDVSAFLRQRLRPILVAYTRLAGRFGNKWATEVRNEYLEGLTFSGDPLEIDLSDPPSKDELPKFAYAAEVKATKEKKQGKKKDDEEEEDDDEDEEEEAKGKEDEEEEEDDDEDEEEDDGEVTFELTVTRAVRDALLTRFEASDEEELGVALGECLDHGVAFTLTSKEFKAAKRALKCDDANQLSDRVKASFVAKLGK